MKLLLASSGFTNEDIIAACESLTGKPRANINFAIINEAIKGEPGDHRWFTESLQEITNNFGGMVEFIDLVAHHSEIIMERIEHADVVFCFGGNTDYLANSIRKTGFDQILPTILKEKVWVGSSAGSCVLCHKETAKTQKEVYGEDASTNQYLNIVPAVFLPHWHGDFFRGMSEEEMLEESKQANLPVYVLSDQAALQVTGEPGNFNFEMIGSDYLIAQDGEIVKA